MPTASLPMIQKYGVKSIALVSRDYAAARDISKAIKQTIDGKDVKVVIDEYFPAGTADFSSQIAKGQQLKPDLWVGLLYPSEAIETVRQFHSMNYMPKLFVANGVSQDDFITAAGKDAEYAVGMSLYEPSLPSEGNKEFVKTHREKYDSDPGYYAAFGFVAGTVLEAAVKKAGSTDAEKVREVLTTLKLGTVMGKHEVDPTTVHADRRARTSRSGSERQARGDLAGGIQDRRAEIADTGLGQAVRSGMKDDAAPLELRDVTSGYGDVPVIRRASMTFRERLITTIVGSNGAGKSTAVKVAAGLLRAWQGSVVDVWRWISRGEPAPTGGSMRGIAYVPQGRIVVPEMTVRDNLDDRRPYPGQRPARHRGGDRAGVATVSGLEGAHEAARRHHERRRTADARDRPRPDDEPEDHHAGRASLGLVTQICRDRLRTTAVAARRRA